MKKTFVKPLTYIACCALIAGAAGTTVFAANESSASADKPKTAEVDTAKRESGASFDEAKKEETVYVLAGADGSANKVIVSDWLKNTGGSSTISEISSLKNVENVKGDETFSESGDKRTWNADGNDIYYQGTTSEALPVSMRISYKLDGADISPEALKGKSGRVTIRFDYDNTAFEEVEIKGKKEKIYVPFAVITGLILNNDVFKNVELTNAKLINDGDRSYAVGAAFPKLRDTLGAGIDKFEIPDHIEISADAENFEMMNTVSIVTNELFNKVDIDGGDEEADDLIADVDKLSDAMNKISDGANDLADGLSELLEKTNEMADGIDQLSDGSQQLYDGIEKLFEKSGDLSDGVTQLYDGSKQLSDGIGTLREKTKPLSEGVTKLYDGSVQLSEGAVTLSGGAVQLSEGADKLSAGTDKLSGGAVQLTNGLETLVSNNDSLTAGAKQVFDAVLVTANSQLEAAGITGHKLTVENYSSELDSIMSSLDEKAVKKLAESTALSEVTKAVKANEAAVRTGVEEAVCENVTAKVIPVVKAGVREAVLASQGLTEEKLAQGVAAGAITAEQQKMIDAAVEQQMSTEEIRAKIKAATDQQMASAEVQAVIEENVNKKIDELISENMKSAEVQSKIKEATSKAGAGLEKIVSLKAQLDSLNTFYTGVVKYTEGVASAAEGAKALTSGINDVQSGAQSLASGAKDLSDGASALSEGSKQVSGGLSELNSSIPALTDGVDQLYEGSNSLTDGLSKLNDNIPALVDGITQLRDGSEKLNEGLSELDGNMPALKDGVTQLSDGSGELADGCEKFNEEGINKIVSLVDGDLNSIIDRFHAMQDVSGSYGTFSGDSGSVKFIFRTEAIENEK